MTEPILPRALPHANWYPVAELLVAGEYPGAKHGFTARQRLEAFLDAGITSFIDLTEAGEYQRGGQMRPYDAKLLPLAASRGMTVSYRRFPMRDLDVPDRATMRAILDAIDQEQREGRVVYVHCYSGVGRAGTPS